MGTATLVVHHISYVIAILLTLAGVALTITALVTEQWLIADHKLTADSTEIHRHGLWKNCIDYYSVDRSDRSEKQFLKALCTLKEPVRDEEGAFRWSEDRRPVGASGNFDTNPAHQLRTWNIIMLVLLAVSGACGLFAVMVGLSASISFCKPNACCGKCCSVLWTLTLVLAFGAGLAAVVYFIYQSYQPDVRSERLTAVNSRIDQVSGSSFYEAVIAVILYGVSLVFALIATIMSFLIGHHRHAHTSRVSDIDDKPHYMANTRV